MTICGKLLRQEKEQLPLLKINNPNSVFYTALRGLVVTGYMLSEKVGTEYLDYDPVPGAYEGCVPLSENGGMNFSLKTMYYRYLENWVHHILFEQLDLRRYRKIVLLNL